MDITVDELMENAFVLTVNQDRLNMFMERWDRYGLKRPRPFWGFHMRTGRYNEVDLSIGRKAANCSFSHYAMVKMAEALDLPFIFILEDDAMPCKHILEKLPKALVDLPDDIYVLKLGGWVSDHASLTYGTHLKTYSTFGSHAYVLFKKYYKEYERVFNSHNCTADLHLINHRGDTHGPNIRIFAHNEELFVQKSPEIKNYNEIHPKNTIIYKYAQQSMNGGEDFDWD